MKTVIRDNKSKHTIKDMSTVHPKLCHEAVRAFPSTPPPHSPFPPLSLSLSLSLSTCKWYSVHVRLSNFLCTLKYKMMRRLSCRDTESLSYINVQSRLGKIVLLIGYLDEIVISFPLNSITRKQNYVVIRQPHSSKPARP